MEAEAIEAAKAAAELNIMGGLASVTGVPTVRRIAQRKLEEELEYVETDSVYSYRL